MRRWSNVPESPQLLVFLFLHANDLGGLRHSHRRATAHEARVPKTNADARTNAHADANAHANANENAK